MDNQSTPFDAHLFEGERVVWHGAPVEGVRLKRRWQDVSAGLVGIAACAMLWGVYAYLADQHSGGIGMVVAGWIILALIFAILALSMYHIFVKHGQATRELSRARYGVTDRRAIVLEGGRMAQVFSLTFTADTNLHVTEMRPATLSLWDSFQGGNNEAQAAALQFHHLARSDEPARLIREILQGFDGT